MANTTNYVMINITTQEGTEDWRSLDSTRGTSTMNKCEIICGLHVIQLIGANHPPNCPQTATKTGSPRETGDSESAEDFYAILQSIVQIHDVTSL
jgi:hypothetical protein